MQHEFFQDRRRTSEPSAPGIVVGLDVRVIWWGWQEAAKRAGIDRRVLLHLIETGQVESDCTWVWVASRDGTASVKQETYWVKKDSVLAWAKREAEREPVAECDGEPCVLYGLLTAADARELDRRKAKRAGRLFAV